MKVVYILRGPYGVLGGAASYMIPECMQKYASVRVLSCVSPHSQEQIVYENEELDVVNIFSNTKKDLLFNAYKALASFDPDVIHVFQGPNCLDVLSSLSTLFPKAVWVLDIRTQIIATDKIQKKKKRRLFFYSQFYVKHIFGQSKHTISSSLPLRFRPYTEVPIGLRMENFDSTDKRVTGSPSKFIFVGLLAKEREIDLLLMAFSGFIENSSYDSTLDLVGDGSAMDALKDLVVVRKLKGIRFLGAKTQLEVNQLMAQYDVGVAYVPNGVYDRAPSLKSIEYAASKLPILASDTRGHRDYEQRFGFKFNYFPNTLESMRDAFAEISMRSDFEDEVANNWLRSRRFDWSNIVVADILPIYKNLISDK